jgi:hypothetical protein
VNKESDKCSVKHFLFESMEDCVFASDEDLDWVDRYAGRVITGDRLEAPLTKASSEEFWKKNFG